MAEEKQKTAKFFLTKSRYLRQAGEPIASYVAAAPSAPVVVVLPAKIMRERVERDDKGKIIARKMVEIDQPEDAFLKRVQPAAPVDVRPNVKASTPPPAHSATSLPMGPGGQRASDAL